MNENENFWYHNYQVVQGQLVEYYDRIDKAIEYIEKNKSGFKNYYLSDMELNYLYLLDILKGSDKE